jgi:hypothetical protein
MSTTEEGINYNSELYQFYPHLAKGCDGNDTVCIPAWLEVMQKRYAGPTNPTAEGYDEKLFKKYKTVVEGATAEEALLHSFQKSPSLGGIVLSGLKQKHFKRSLKGIKKEQGTKTNIM